MAMGELLRWICIVAAFVMTLVGLVSFGHDCLMLAGLAKPVGDGPGGLVAGPIFAAVGIWLVWKAIKMTPSPRMK